jgi:hypothetical protein
MPGLGPGIHVFLAAEAKTWMAGTSPAMTVRERSAFLPFSPPKLSSPAKAGDPVFQRPQRLIDRPRRTGSPGQAGRRQRCLAPPTCICDVPCDCPTGKSLLIFRNRVKPRNQKYSASRLPQITPTTSAIPRPQEGRIAIVTDVGCGERWPRHAGRATRLCRVSLLMSEGRVPTNGVIADGKAVWFWRPLLASSRRRCCEPNRALQDLQSAGDGGKRNSSPGRARYKP